jgi:hypothetical protein
MIRLPSLQKTWSMFVTCDLAIVKRPAADDAAALADWQAKIKAARETGDWTPVTVDGQQPTKFQMGQVDRNVWRVIQDRATLTPGTHGHIGFVQLAALLFRLSIRDINGLDLKIERAVDPEWGWLMASPAIVNALDEADPSIVGELGMEVFNRLRGLSPLV